MLNKVPEVTLYFWVIKCLCTTIGETFSDKGIAFTQQFLKLYTATIGSWSYLLILSAAFVTMFSTTLTCIDGYPRSLAACCTLIGDLPPKRFSQIHRFWVIISVIIAAIVVFFFVKNLLQLLRFAALISFLTSPVLAFINYKVMNGDNVPAADRPGPFLKYISWAGLAFFVLMALGFFYATFFAAG